ncbi:AfsR/SARP family transcriptional regulator [Nonomuraea sp. SBT364]|uniref:AfsR/SARP family transcriptional regulator n=1 Tax=Nonomuraea sp. SBT364 TaxID=1580530 RepID=UPI0018CCBA4C|nr:AfsR/SARP family transcriptional regulator [Nonomuraea sp. SBT364]
MEVSAGERPLPALAPRHRAFLGCLLLHAGRAQSVERLIGAVWGPTPPDTARAQVHAALAAIRRVLRAAGAADQLRTSVAGYVLTTRPGQLDLEDFTALVTTAEDDPGQSARHLRSALALWRGPALADVHADYAPGARARLEDRRLTAVERLADLELAAGRHEGLIDLLGAELAGHPLRERLTGQLMLALNRAGRQADALSTGRGYRARLVREQGLDPGPAFLAVEESVLHGPIGPVVRASGATAGESRRGEPAAVRKATFLPYDIADFAGRTAELTQLIDAPSPTGDAVPSITAIDGMAGIGKTALAVHAAHHLAAHYPDGRLFVDLHAHTAGRQRVTAFEALEALLRQLGIRAEAIPAQAEERAALWRAELAGRRVLVVLDNAADAAHVRPLLPGPSDSLVLITSRRRLTDLDGVRSLPMDVLPAADATELFTRIAGERAVREPDAVAEVLLLCGFLPLAVRIAGARLRHRPRWSVAYLAQRLRDERRRLSELATAERGVAAAFALSYRQLDEAERRLFRLLGLHPGRDVDPHAAAALAGTAVPEAEERLEALLDTHMLQQHEPGRYRFHDLLRQYAHDTAAEEPPPERHAALTRLLDHHLSAASAAMDLLYPDSAHRRPRTGPPTMRFGGVADARAWLEAERGNLVRSAAHACDTGRPAHTGLLATTLYRYLYDHALHDDALTLYGKALAAARQLGDPAGEGRALTDLGWVRHTQGDHRLAAEHFEQALTVCRSAGDRRGQARALTGLGDVRARTGDHGAALAALGRSLELFRELGDRFGEAVTTDYLGVAHERQGRFAEAAGLHREALELFRGIGSRGGEADALHHLGVARLRQGRPAQADGHHRDALELYRRFGYRRGEAKALNGVAAAALALGEPGRARTLYRAALDVAVEVGDLAEQSRARTGLGLLDREGGHDRAAPVRASS